MASHECSLVEVESDSSEPDAVSEAVRGGSSSCSSTTPGPPRAKISRSRVVPTTAGKLKTERAKRGNKYTGSNVVKKSLWDRTKDFPGEGLTVQGGKLFCGSCSEILSSKKSIVGQHCLSIKHRRSKEEAKKSSKKAQTLGDALRRADASKPSSGQTLPMEMRVWRLKVVTTFLSAGIPVGKIDKLRPLLEENHHRLTDSSNLLKLIPMILEEELQQIREELRQPGVPIGRYQSRELSVIFDGTTRLGEAIAVVVRFVDDEWIIQQRLIRLDVVAKAVTGDQLAQVIQSCLVDFTIRGPQMLASVHDGASVNSAAMRRLLPFFPLMFDLTCVSHTIDNVGRRFDVPTLDEFCQRWISMFSHSHAAKLRWREQTGATMKTFSDTRWWSRWEVLDQACTFFAEIQPFLENNQDLAPKTADHLRAMFNDADRVRNLKLELAAVVDIGQHFVKMTYTLEGDGPLIFTAYRKLQQVLNACTANHMPNVDAVARKLVEESGENVHDLKMWAKDRVQPAILWFVRKFNVDLLPQVEVFRYVRFFCPVQVQSLHPDAAAIEELRRLPFLDDDQVIAGLQQELPTYLAACDGCQQMTDEEKVLWWRNNSTDLPHWAGAVKKVLLLQVSSATVERVFSLLHSAFSQQQQHALSDYLQASVMLRYNHCGQQ